MERVSFLPLFVSLFLPFSIKLGPGEKRKAIKICNFQNNVQYITRTISCQMFPILHFTVYSSQAIVIHAVLAKEDTKTDLYLSIYDHFSGKLLRT